MAEILPGIHHLKIPIPDNPLGHTNVFLVRGDHQNTLIDAGWDGDEAFDSLEKQLAEIGVGVRGINQILVTHGHLDHYGLAGRVKQVSGASIVLHELDTASMRQREQDIEKFHREMEQWLRINGAPKEEMEMNWTPRGAGYMRRSAAIPIAPDIAVRGGETFSAGNINLEVMWTPGHSPGHICLYERTRKLLFSGDHVLPVITPNISLRGEAETTNPLGVFIQSLIDLRELDVSLVLPAHEHLFTNLKGRINEILAHHQHRKGEIAEALRSGPKTAYEISTRITWMPDLGGVKWQDMAPWDKRMAIPETLAHLEAMIVDGEVAKFTRDDVIYYRLNGVRK